MHFRFPNIALAVVALSVLLGWPASVATATDTGVGTTTRVQNQASATRGGATLALETGADVLQGDRLETGENARLEVRLVDETTLTLGGNARLLVDEYVFNPGGDLAKVTVEAVAGPFRFLTGRINTLANRQVTVITPFATIGIRGTDFWGGPIRGAYGILVLDGVIEVTNAGVTRVLDTPGAGVDIASPDAAPGPIVIWGQGKVDEAVASISFTQ